MVAAFLPLVRRLLDLPFVEHATVHGLILIRPDAAESLEVGVSVPVRMGFVEPEVARLLSALASAAVESSGRLRLTFDCSDAVLRHTGSPEGWQRAKPDEAPAVRSSLRRGEPFLVWAEGLLASEKKT